MARLGRGECSWPQQMVEIARLEFLNTLVGCAPRVIEDLLASVRFEELGLDGPDPYASSAPRWPRPVHPAIGQWAEKYHLNEDWLLDFALDTLEDGVPGYRRLCMSFTDLVEHPLDPAATEPLIFALRPLDFVRPQPTSGWNPALETRSEAKNRIREAFDAALSAHMDKVEKATTSRGQVRPLRKTGPGDTERRHFEWLVRHQCLGESYAHIARAELASGAYQAVAAPVHKLAALIGLTLRPPQRGRPPGSREAHPRRRAR